MGNTNKNKLVGQIAYDVNQGVDVKIIDVENEYVRVLEIESGETRVTAISSLDIEGYYND